MKHRLYLAKWTRLNDPHEAQMVVPVDGLSVHANPERLKQLAADWLPIEISRVPTARVCSLSATWRSNLLWSHYAGDHTGIAIGFELPGALAGIEIVKVRYDDKVPIVKPPIEPADVREALRHKSREWAYEEEIRLISFSRSRRFVEGLELREVIFGLRTSADERARVKKLVDDRRVSFWRLGRKARTYALTKSSD